MSNKITPGWSGALSLWAGSDHYGFWQMIRREAIEIPEDRVINVYEIEAKPLIGIGGAAKYALEYRSDSRDCFVSLEDLPESLKKRPRTRVNPPGAFLRLFQHSSREPTALLLPFVIPFSTMLMMFLLGLWDEYVLHRQDLLAFFANPGCDTECVGKVLRIHSMVGFLFLVQFSLIFLPLGLLLFQAPRYRSAVNYRMVQGYSLATIVIGSVVFLQLIAFFPFKHYGRFLEMGFDPKVERLLSNLKKPAAKEF